MMKTSFAHWSALWTLLLVLCASETGYAQHLPVVNGGFEITANPAKGRFTTVQPQGWIISPAPVDTLAFVYKPGSASDGAQISVWPTFPHESPAKGNFVGSDGDSNYSGVISQTLIGTMQPNQKYLVSFYEAAGQEVNFHGPTTENWRVSLGGLPAQLSTGFSLPNHGVGQWRKEKLYFTSSTSIVNPVLEFFSVGTPNGIPPVAFLDGVGNVLAVPEPGSLLLVGIGLIVSVGFSRSRRKSAKA